MVANNMASRPTSTDARTQQAIAAMDGQILPGAMGVGGSGFVPVDALYGRSTYGVRAGSATGNYDTAAGIEQMRAQRIAELQSLADQPLDRGFTGVQVLIEGVGSTGGPIPQRSAEQGAIRNLNRFEGQLAFNPAPQAAESFVDRGLELANGAYRLGGAAFDAALFAAPGAAGEAAALMKQPAQAVLRSAGETFGPNVERLIERTTPGLRSYVVPEGVAGPLGPPIPRINVSDEFTYGAH